MSLDLLPALRDAVIGIPGIPELISAWHDEPSVFTRRPVPGDAADPMIIINEPTSIIDADGLTSDRPIASHDIAVYGNKGAPGSDQDQTRQVEAAAYLLRQHFHRNRFSVQPSGFSVIGVRVMGPVRAPDDDDSTVGRLVSVVISLRRTS